MACVIAQRCVHPVVVHSDPLTEHKQLFVRAYERVHQQVPFFYWMQVVLIAPLN